jgi:hypothetical protein
VCPWHTEGYESLSEIRLAAKRQSTLGMLLADTCLHAPRRPGSSAGDEEEAAARLLQTESSFLERVHTISEGLRSARCGGSMEPSTLMRGGKLTPLAHRH